jgi:hypothetical protein
LLTVVRVDFSPLTELYKTVTNTVRPRICPVMPALSRISA